MTDNLYQFPIPFFLPIPPPFSFLFPSSLLFKTDWDASYGAREYSVAHICNIPTMAKKLSAIQTDLGKLANLSPLPYFFSMAIENGNFIYYKT